MSEEIVVRQNSKFLSDILTLDEQTGKFRPARHVNDMSPYGLLLAGLGLCTTVLLHAYAQNHDVELDEVEIMLGFNEVSAENCKNCDETLHHEEHIKEAIRLRGKLTEEEQQKLFKISDACPIRRMIEAGIHIDSRLIEEDIKK